MESRLQFLSLMCSITRICLYNFDPLKPHFYIVKLGFTGVYIIFLISAQKHRLWELVRTASQMSMLWLTLSKGELGQQRQQEGGTLDIDFQFDFDFKIWGVATNELQ